MNAQANAMAQTNAGAYYCEIPSDPCAIVMFGASGDLAKRKLLPALYDLAVHACLAPRFRVMGFARTHMSDDDFRREARTALPQKNRSIFRRVPSTQGKDRRKRYMIMSLGTSVTLKARKVPAVD